MTKEKILQLEAGRGLDILVMERVMGYTREPREFLPEHHWAWIESVSKQPTYLLPKFSMDIADAWKVVEKMLGCGVDFSMANTENQADFMWGVDFYIMIDEAAVAKVFSANGPTAPLTICRAALLAVTGGQ